MARLNFAGVLSNLRTDAPVVGEGIEPAQEAQLATSITMLSGRFLEASDRNGALIGEGLAHALRLAPGDPVTVIAATVDGAMNTIDLEVIGVFRSFSKDYDERAIKLPLATAQELMGTPDANVIVLLLEHTSKTFAVATLAAPTFAMSSSSCGVLPLTPIAPITFPS